MRRIRQGRRCLFGCLLCLLLTACSTIPEEQRQTTASSSTTTATPATSFSFTMGCIEGDTFHPYTAKTAVNRAFSSLLYESLYTLDDGLMPSPCLAVSPHGGEDGMTPADQLTITLREDARFSNGASVTAEDVVASFELAKKSNRYRLQLSIFTSVAAVDTHTVELRLKTPDIHCLSRLTFPIVEKASAETRCPVGSGPYYLNKTGDHLLRQSHSRLQPQITEIALKSYRNSDALRHALGTGQISFYFHDLSEGEIPRVSAANSPVDTSSLVFLGFNSRRKELSSTVRQAIDTAMDRTQVCQSSFAGYAQTALTPFHPRWKWAETQSCFSATRDAAAAMALMQQADYPPAGEAADSNTLSLSLLVSDGSQFRLAAAEQIASQLSGIGITVTVEQLEYKAYLKRLKKGDFDLYLGEVRLVDSLDLSPFFSSDGEVSFGITGDSAATYRRYQAGQLSLAEFLDVFRSELPFLPLCYRQAFAAYNRSLQNVSFTGFDLFSTIQNWTIPSH